MAEWLTTIAACCTGVFVCFLSLRRYVNGKVFREKVNLTGKTIIITGANSGIGKTAALELCKMGTRVILACRSVSRGEEAASEIQRSTGKREVVVRELDLASSASIKAFTKQILAEERRIDVLVNNAGVFQCPYERTEDGFEMQMGVNYLGIFLLTNLLKERLKDSAPSRIVIISSILSKRGRVDPFHLNMTEEEYDRKAGYNNSKLACNYFARELAHRMEGTGVNVYCMCPGVVNTNLGRHFWARLPLILKLIGLPIWYTLTKDCFHGCQTILYCTASKHNVNESGFFYTNCGKSPWPEGSVDKSRDKMLWEQSVKLVGL